METNKLNEINYSNQVLCAGIHQTEVRTNITARRYAADITAECSATGITAECRTSTASIVPSAATTTIVPSALTATIVPSAATATIVPSASTANIVLSAATASTVPSSEIVHRYHSEECSGLSISVRFHYLNYRYKCLNNNVHNCVITLPLLYCDMK